MGKWTLHFIWFLPTLVGDALLPERIGIYFVCVGLSWVLYSSLHWDLLRSTEFGSWSPSKERSVYLTGSLLSPKNYPIDLQPEHSKHKTLFSFDQDDIPVIWDCIWRRGCPRGSELVNWVMESEKRKQKKLTDQKAITATKIKRLQTWHWTPFGKG